MSALSKRGHKIFVMIIRPEAKKPSVSYLKEGGLDVIQIHPPSIGITGKKGILRHLKYLSCIPKVTNEAKKIIKKHGIDYIYAYMPGTGSSIPAMRIKSKHKIPYVLDLADMYSMIRPKYIIKKSFREADKIIVITDYLKNILIKQGINENKIFHVPNGVDLRLFDPTKYSDQEILNIRSNIGGEKLIIFAGSLQDLNIIIDSANMVIKKFPKIKYLIIGDHRDKKKSKQFWEKKVQEAGLSNNFIFYGRITRTEIPKYLLCADVCIDSFPNEPYFAAAHPIKLLEYGACAKPIVATRVSETSNLLQNGIFGYLSEPRDVDSYAECLINALSSVKSQQIALTFSKHVRKNFSWEVLSENLEKILEK